MEIKKVKDFNEGEHLRLNLLINSLTKGVTNSGAPYLTLVLQDDTKAIDAKLWDARNEVIKDLEVGRVFEFEFEVIKYRNNLQLKIIRFMPVIQSEININDFIFKSPIGKNELQANLSDAINKIQNEKITKILISILNHYEQAYYEYPAASKIHHSFVGGLATHVNGMINLALALCTIYPELQYDYLVAGVILHDLGKIEELSSPVATEYTTKGRLLGHISILQAVLYDVAKQMNMEDSEEVTLLRHLVLSHHGQLEFGSPVRPMVLEAEILYYLDNIDAKINTITKALEEVNVGEFTQKLFALENRQFYKFK